MKFNRDTIMDMFSIVERVQVAKTYTCVVQEKYISEFSVRFGKAHPTFIKEDPHLFEELFNEENREVWLSTMFPHWTLVGKFGENEISIRSLNRKYKITIKRTPIEKACIPFEYKFTFETMKHGTRHNKVENDGFYFKRMH